MHLEEIRALPKVLLHDHLDGGLRPQTVIDLARDCGYSALPTHDAGELGQWFVDAANSGSLVRYLETFEHTVSVMQTEDAIRRVAAECAEDLADDGVVYAEVRFAPELLTAGGLSMAQAVEAALDGFDTDRIVVNVLLCAMRQSHRGDEVADLVVAFRNDGVCGMDIAGPEDGFPPSLFAEPFAKLRANMCRYTIHAGEAAGVPSIADALAVCSAERLGHGVRIIEDIRLQGEDDEELGDVAQYVLDRQIPLEVCPSSNLQTGIASTIADHPVTVLNDLGFAVTINTDNRLMSGTTLSREMYLLASEAGWELEDLYVATMTAANASFQTYEERADLIEAELQPAWEA